MKPLSAVLAIVLFASCSLIRQKPAAFEPAGTYDFTSEFQGQSISGTLVLRQTPQGLAGSFSTPLSGELPFDGISVEGRKMLLRAVLPDGDLQMSIDFDDDYRITGQWSLAGGVSGSMSGARRPPDR